MKVMGIVNVTPDSFSDGGRFTSAAAVIEHAGALIAEGASLLDVGGESTRPGAVAVDLGTELERVVPVIGALATRWPDITISIDTNKSEVAEQAVAAGASIINDVSASLENTASALGVGWIAMHSGGPSRTMQDDPRYDDVVEEVADFLAHARHRGIEAGIDPQQIWIDPGIGFGKTLAHNLELVANLDRFAALGSVIFGVSRKRSIGELHAQSDGTLEPSRADDRLEGSLAMATWGAFLGADMVRVHDVRATVHAVRVFAAVTAP